MSTAPVQGETVAKPIGLGDTMANGAFVLAVKPSLAHKGDVVVLAVHHRMEFVTWIMAPDGSMACWGHYYGQDLAKAVTAFENRR